MSNINRQRVYIRIKDFLFGKKNREFLIFLFFFCLSSVFWLLLTLNETFQTEIRIPLRLQNVPTNLVITTDLPEEVRFMVEDKGTVLMKYLYGQTFQPIEINYKDYTDLGNDGRIQIREADVRKKAMQQLYASTKILNLKPDTIEFFYNRGLKKKIPVRLAGDIDMAPQYYLRDISFQNDSVVVYAPPAILDTLEAAYTEPVDVHSLSKSKSLTMDLRKIRGAKFVPTVTSVTLNVDIYTEKTVEVPVRGVNFPADKDLRTFPSKVNVTFKVGSKNYKAVSSEDFVIVISYEEILANEGSKIKLHLKKIPEGISAVRIHPAEVDYLLEQTMEE